MEHKKIIILASERSGTNLLRVLLGRHRHISAPVAVHFFNIFCPILEYYGDLNQFDNTEKLVDHFLQSANHSYTDWNLKIDKSDFIKKFSINSIESAFNAIYQEFALKENKKHYVVKDNDMFNYKEQTEKLNINKDVYYIPLYRDPRDHVVSWLKTPLFLHTPYDIAIKWNMEQNKINEISKKRKVFEMSYENLISNTEEIVNSLLGFLDIELDENCFTTDENNKESLRNEWWMNLSKPIIKNNM